MTKQWQTVQIPLAAGLDTKSDPRASSPPSFELLRDVEWEQPGGLQHRKPFTDFSVVIAGGGSLANIRRIVRNGDELLCFTKDSLYSWSAALGAWSLRGTHLAAKIDEETVFGNSADQLDADRAELGGVIFYSWVESVGNGVNYAGYVAAVDKASGAVLLPPTSFSTNAAHVRLVALTTRVMLVFGEGGQMYYRALDPAAPTVVTTGAVIYTSGIGTAPSYDVCRIAATDALALACTRTTTTSYNLSTITAAGVITSTTKARTSSAAIAVSVDPTGTSVQVCRYNGGNIQGDLIAISGLVDTFTNQAIGTAPGAPGVLTACHRSVQDSGAYRCYAFWEASETSAGGVDWYTQSNWVATDNTVGAAAVFKPRWAPRARPFDREGTIYVWGAFIGRTDFHVGFTAAAGTALQCSYYLLRDDGFLVAKAANCVAGAGAGAPATDGAGWIPGCQDLGGNEYAFAGVVCRRIRSGGDTTSFASRSPRDIVVTFDTNEARRCVRLGRTLYIAAGELLQYDGAALVEVGFHHSPWFVFVASYASAAIPVGTYAYKFGWRAQNAGGDVERSSSLCVGKVTLTAAAQALAFTGAEALYLTHKTSVAWEAWRTAVNPTDDAPFNLISSKDPAVATNPNRFVFNVPSAGYLPDFHDEMTDTVAGKNELSPENGFADEAVAPPACSIVVASADRVFIAGCAGEPQTLWYSKQRVEGEVAAFFDGNRVSLPSYAGAITALAFLNEVLVGFTASSAYALDGQGYDNAGGGLNYGPARLLSSDVGALSHESVVFTPSGIVFKSSKGWYLMNRGWGVDYIGAAVAEFDAEDVLSIDLVETQHQVRILTSARMLVFDYLVGQWAEWTVAGAASSTIFGGVHHIATATSVKAQRTDYAGIDYGLVAKLAPIKLNDLQGAGSIRWLNVLGEYRGACQLQIDLYRDYSTTPYQTDTWTPSPTDIGEPLEVSVGPSIPKCIAIGVKLTVLPVMVDVGDGPIATYSEALKLTGLGLEVGIDRGINRRLPAAQKT